MKLRCRMNWHHWSPWSAPDKRQMSERVTQYGVTVEVREVTRIHQSRECFDCRRFEQRLLDMDGDEQ